MRIAKELIKIAKELYASNSNLTIINIEDTRDYMEEDDRWIPIPGSGISNTCQFCGSQHEVHVTVADKETHKTYIVGTSCAKKMGVPDGELKKAQKALKEKLEKDETAAEEKVVEDILHQVKKMTPPEVVTDNSSGKTVLKMGDVKVICQAWTCDKERLQTLKESWYAARAFELIPKGWEKSFDLKNTLNFRVKKEMK